MSMVHIQTLWQKLWRANAKRLRSLRRWLVSQRRDSRYVFVLAGGLITFVLCCLQAYDKGLFDSVERPIFNAINNLPPMFEGLMHGFTQFGGLASLVFWCGLAWWLLNKRAALTVAVGGVTAWWLAKFVKAMVERGRPGDLLETVRLFSGEVFGGYGFPSGHATFAAACATILYYQIGRKYRRYLILLVLLVGLSRMYLGAHFPLDIVGGWALGAVVGAGLSLFLGNSHKGLTAVQVKKVLRKKGYVMRSVRFASVDARGSRPLFMEDQAGKRYFAKIFGVQEHAADWLFKIYRFFRFKNFQAEEPYINSRRNIEMESFASLWAKQAGVRVPTIVDVLKIHDSWMLIQERLEAVPLSEHPRPKSKTLQDAWEQVAALHAANMAHRDLRAANLMVDKQGRAWIIDFGFAEVSPRKQRQYMDIAELLMSMSLVAGVKRTVDAAMPIVGPDRMFKVLPYLRREVFSGATAKSLKQNKQLLVDLKAAIKDCLDIDGEPVEAKITRINRRKLFNVAIIAVFLYIITPQLNAFSGAFQNLGSINAWWLPLIAATSLATYFITGLIYVILSSVPLQLIRSTLVQLAASFMSKIIPGGVSTAGLNMRYLHRAGIDNVDASAIIVANNTIGFVMFILPLSLFVLFSGQSLASLIAVDITARQLFFAFSALSLIGIILATYRKLRARVLAAVSQFGASIREFTNSPLEVGLAAAASLAVSLCYILCLYACTRALGLDLSLASAVLVYGSAIIAKSVIPTPGGIGPLEVAMVSTMVGLGIDKPGALSAVLLYRLATFWLPIPLSLLAYRWLSNKRII